MDHMSITAKQAAALVNPKAAREKNGQFAIDKMDRVCQCGERLGAHMGEAPRDCDATGCEGFKAARPAIYRAR
jgi:hypothetical protein